MFLKCYLLVPSAERNTATTNIINFVFNAAVGVSCTLPIFDKQIAIYIDYA